MPRMWCWRLPPRIHMRLSSAIFSESFRPMMCSNCFCVSDGDGREHVHMIHAVCTDTDGRLTASIDLIWNWRVYLDEVALRSRENDTGLAALQRRIFESPRGIPLEGCDRQPRRPLRLTLPRIPMRRTAFVPVRCKTSSARRPFEASQACSGVLLVTCRPRMVVASWITASTSFTFNLNMTDCVYEVGHHVSCLWLGSLA